LRFTITGEWDRNRLLQVVVVLYCFFVVLLWLTNWMLYFDSMDFTTASVVNHYLGNESEFRAARTYRGMLELAHFHLFAVGMLMMVLTHLALFVPGWLVRWGGAGFAWTKIAGILLLQGSLAALVGIALWSVFAGNQAQNYGGHIEDEFEDEDWD